MKRIIFFISFILPSLLFAQGNVVVKGVVLDKATNETLIGVSITLDGTPPKALTNTSVRGEFAVSVPANSVLIFKYMGYTNQKVTIKPGQTNIEVKMNTSKNLMDEVVVRGYVARQKEVTTGSSYTVSGREIQDVPVANAEQLLQGKVAGLNIQVNTGAPGYRGSVLIRGLSGFDVSGSGESSFLSPTSPLYVVDNIPIDADENTDYGYATTGPNVSPLNLIPPEDIQSIEVLKDAQATSLYGSRGAYGVIIITTKRGNSKIPRVRFDSKFYLAAVPKLRETLGGRAERNAKLTQIRDYGTYNDGFEEWYIAHFPILSDSLNAFYNNSTDWQAVFNGNRFNHTQNLAIDGGDDKFNYKTNFKYYQQKGIVANTGFNSYTTNMNMNYKPNNSFNVFVNVLAGLGKQNRGSGVGQFQTGVAKNTGASSLLPGPSLFQSTSGVLSAFNIKNDNASRDLNTNAEVSFSPLEGLRFISSGSYQYRRGTEETFTPAAANNNLSSVFSFNNRKEILYNRNSINYSKTIGYTHSFSVNVFNEISKRSFQAGYIMQNGTANDQIQGPLGSNGVLSRGGGVLDNYANENTVSFAGAFTYDYMKKYVLDLSFRMDASSRSGFDDPYSENPSVGFRWNFNKEKIFEDLKWLTFGDVRLSWGRNIRPTGSIYTLYGTYVPTGTYIGAPRIGSDFWLIPNNTRKPTTNTTYNFGFDIGLFDSKLEVLYDTYYRRVSNLTREIGLPTTAGFAAVVSDGAELINYGHELSLTIRPLPKTSAVNWTVSVNGAINNDVVTKLPGTLNQILLGSTDKEPGTTILRRGRNTLSGYMIQTNGVYTNDADVPVDPVTGLLYRSNTTSSQAYFQAGDPNWEDVNGDYIVSDADKKIMGNSQPIATGGVSTSVAYKGFSLMVNGVYNWKRSVINNALSERLRLVQDPFGQNAILRLDDIDFYTPTNPGAKFANPYDYERASAINPFRPGQSLFLEDGSYFKINTVTFGYTFKKDFVKRLNLNALKLYLSAYNVYTFSNYSGANAENVTPLGYDVSGGYPVPRIYNVGFTIEL